MVTNTTATTETELVETGERRDRLGRRITPAARRTELVTAWRVSGQTQAAFARREGIKYSSFAAWVQAERRAGSTPARPQTAPGQPAVRFAQVRWPAPAPGLEARLPDGTLLRGGSAGELAVLVRALRS